MYHRFAGVIYTETTPANSGEECIFVICRCQVLVLTYFAYTSNTGKSKRYKFFFRFLRGVFHVIGTLAERYKVLWNLPVSEWRQNT
jgi:hypothetical protein